MFGLLLVGAFATVVRPTCSPRIADAPDVRRRVLVGDGSPLRPILYANGVSFLVVSMSSFVILCGRGGSGHQQHTGMQEGADLTDA